MNKTEQLLNAVLKGIKEKKGNDIISMNFKKTDNSVCDYFVICDAESTKQVEAIADSIDKVVRKDTSEKILHKEGFENAQWILLDYIDIVVHIFQTPYREFYNLEELWADAEIKKIQNLSFHRSIIN